MFRGKSDGLGETPKGEWVYGNLIIACGYCFILEENEDDRADYPYLNERGCIDGYAIPIDPWTIGRYTELADSYGRPIYEGDILKLTVKNSPAIEWTAVVKFGNPNCTYSWGWQLDRISGDDPNPDILLWVDMEDAGVLCKVIGNIHDNLELLKEA